MFLQRVDQARGSGFDAELEERKIRTGNRERRKFVPGRVEAVLEDKCGFYFISPGKLATPA